MQRIGIKEDRMILLAHRACKLIHDSTVAAVEIILRILTDQRDIHHRYIESICILQDHTCQNFQRCGR